MRFLFYLACGATMSAGLSVWILNSVDDGKLAEELIFGACVLSGCIFGWLGGGTTEKERPL